MGIKNNWEKRITLWQHLTFDEQKRSFYEKECANARWSVRKYKHQIVVLRFLIFTLFCNSSNEIAKNKLFENEKTLLSSLTKGSFSVVWRREWGSNPRYIAVRRFSGPVPSTTRTSLQKIFNFRFFGFFLEFLLDMLFLKHRWVGKKPDSIRVFGALASEMRSTFQDQILRPLGHLSIFTIALSYYSVFFCKSQSFFHAFFGIVAFSAAF